jgi:hypothetical protein
VLFDGLPPPAQVFYEFRAGGRETLGSKRAGGFSVIFTLPKNGTEKKNPKNKQETPVEARDDC